MDNDMLIRRRLGIADPVDVNELTLSESLKKIDAFVKLPNECVHSTSGGGGVSLVTFILIAFLVFSEINYFLFPDVVFNYSVDNIRDGLLPINIDISVAMKCSDVSIDVVDSHGGLVGKSSEVKAIDCTFALSHKRSELFQTKRRRLSSLRENYHSIYQLFWLSHGSFSNRLMFGEYDNIREESASPSSSDSCRFVGTFNVKKTQGNMHVTTGKAIDLPMNTHLHISNIFGESKKNFSHRIHHLSFGTPMNGHLQPLDAEEFISSNSALMYQYFIQVVPTALITRRQVVETYQYAVTEQARFIDHTNDSHGVPGLFFRYDVSPVRVDVVETGDTLVRLLVRLSAIIGGVFATVAFVCQLVTHLVPTFMCSIGVFRRRHGDGGRPGLGPEPLMPEADL